MADPITDILEEIADAISSISGEAADLLENMSGFVEELEDMVVIDRMDARTEDEMWDEEVRRLKALHEKEAELVAALMAIGGIDDPEHLENYIFDLAQDEATRKRANIAYQLLIIRETIREILFQDPGVIPETLVFPPGNPRAFPNARAAPYRDSHGRHRGYDRGNNGDPY